MKWYTYTNERLQTLDRRSLFLIIFSAALVSFLSFQFWKQPSQADRANWDYFSQVIARGGVPYRDVVNIKTPLSAYIGAAAIVTSRPFGLRDLIAIRVAYLLLAALTVGFTFLVAHDSFGSRLLAVLAAAIMMAFKIFGETNSGGVQSKTPMVLFGLMSLWGIHHDRPVLAGLFGMLSALSWQPGLLFVGVAVLAFSQYLTVWSDKKVIRVVVGASIPLAILLTYFWIQGALRDFYLWNIHFNYSVYAPSQARTVFGFVDRLLRMLRGTFSGERIYFYLATLGLVVTLLQEVKQALRRRGRYLLEGAPRHAIILAPAVYFLFCMINIQGGADLIPLLPFIAIWGALALVIVLGIAVDLLASAQSRLPSSAVHQWCFAGLLGLILTINGVDALTYEIGLPTLKDQDEEIAEITSRLGPGDKIFAQGTAQVLVLSGLQNASRHYFLDRGKDSYLDRVEPGGFAGWFERLKEERPKVVALDRTKNVDHKDDFYDWVHAEYEEQKGRIFSYYVRRDGGQ